MPHYNPCTATFLYAIKIKPPVTKPKIRRSRSITITHASSINDMYPRNKPIIRPYKIESL